MGTLQKIHMIEEGTNTFPQFCPDLGQGQTYYQEEKPQQLVAIVIYQKLCMDGWVCDMKLSPKTIFGVEKVNL